ncbi:hypothetical protein [Mycolicibacterium wolinskyi]
MIDERDQAEALGLGGQDLRGCDAPLSGDLAQHPGGVYPLADISRPR